MSMKAYKPTSPAQRGMTSQDFSQITHKKPVRSLLVKKPIKAGRNNQGKITVRHQGGGVKKFYRLVNFKLAPGTTAVVEAIEYDPNRSARIARIKDQNGTSHYVIADASMRVGKKISSGDDVAIDHGNRMTLSVIPTGTMVHNVELRPGQGGKLIRSAGTSAQLMSKEGEYAQLRMPSGEVRMINVMCMATIGIVSNEQHSNVSYGKAGRSRRRGIRPSVRGVVMNPVDHPHGGGEGRGKGGNPMTPWGKPARGLKTRTRKSTSKYIVRSRHAAKRK